MGKEDPAQGTESWLDLSGRGPSYWMDIAGLDHTHDSARAKQRDCDV